MPSFPAHITGRKSDAAVPALDDAKTRRSRRRKSSSTSTSTSTSALPTTGTVPRASKPKARPPTSLRDKLHLFHTPLPAYSGPYSVGTMDVELPAAAPSPFAAHIHRHHLPLLRLETVLFTLYYPASGARARPPDGRSKWSRPTWLPRPRREVAKGYGRFAGMGEGVRAVAWFAGTTMLTKVPAWRNAPVARHWPPPRGEEAEGEGMEVPFEVGSEGDEEGW